MDAYNKYGHFANNYAMNELASKHYIMGGKRTVKHYIQTLCTSCRNRNAAPLSQVTASLPLDRVEAQNFQYIATIIDYFRPILIRQVETN